MRAADAAIGLAFALSAFAAQGADDAVLLNPFADPFVHALGGRPCESPLGPAYTARERLAESHSRVERGTTCWLNGLCREPNAYRYDADIAAAVVAALRAEPALATASVWVTAQRRFVYLEGCTADARQALLVERTAGRVADVERVIPALALPGDKPPYRIGAAPTPAR